MKTQITNKHKIFFDLIIYNEAKNAKHDYINLGSFFIYEKDLKDISTKSICEYIKNNMRNFVTDFYNDYIKENEIETYYDIFKATFIKLRIITKYSVVYTRYLTVSNIHKI